MSTEDKVSITLLHVSDMQFGRNHRFGEMGQDEGADAKFDTLFQRLSIDLTTLEQLGARPEIIVISGDLAEWGQKNEFEDAYEFVCKLTERLQIPKRNVVLIPGNHDINRKLSQGYVANCEGNGESPVKPYWPKWQHYRSLFEKFYSNESGITFTQNEPWTLYEIEKYRTVIAGINSTIAESHFDDTHFGWTGETQLRWFAERLKSYQSKGWLRIGVIHHNLVRGAVADEENLRDVDDFNRILTPHLNLILHGHTHEDGLNWADNNVPIIATGSAALKPNVTPLGIGNQYQIVRLWKERFERWTRCYDAKQKRWIGDNRCSHGGDVWHYEKTVAFASVESTFSIVPNPSLKDVNSKPVDLESSVVQVSKPISAETARHQLRKLPRFLLKPENQHRAVRRDEQAALANLLQSRQVAWLVADWGSGKEGFLASSLERLGGPESLDSIYRLQCGATKNCNELLREAEVQLGLSFQEFFATIAALPQATLVFDDLPYVIACGDERENFERKVRPIFDFCPQLKLIFITRQAPKSTEIDEVITLLPLDIADTRKYLRFHPRAQSGLDDSHELERIFSWSGGLPMHLDRLLERLPFLALQTILDEYVDTASGNHVEPLPQSLKTAVAQLAEAETKQTKQSFRLLKVLTVLRDGETFESIKRFYDKSPFHQTNIDELVGLALLEDVPISQTAADFTLYSQRKTLANVNAPKLLRIPRQVRDHVNSLITDDERDDIIRTSTGIFFGPRWTEGKIRLRTTLFNAYGHSAIAGPGNEHVVARHLLERALDKGTKSQIEKFARLAVTYCHKLILADRFRDALISAGAIMELLKDTMLDKEYVETAHIYGRALRMIGNETQAAGILEDALARGNTILIDEYKADVVLSLALCYQDLKRNDEALTAARSVLNLAHPESGNAYQAQAIIAALTMAGTKQKSRLVQLEEAARNKGQENAANNISMDLAFGSKNPDESLRWLNKVIVTATDTYNRARAVIEKVSVLRAYLRISELTPRDRHLLDAAYSYGYAQRIGNLLDRCHNVLWELFKREGLWAAVLRLYRFSSFIWRLRGSDERDRKYLHELDSLDIQQIRNVEGQTLNIEILYLERRRQEQLPE